MKSPLPYLNKLDVELPMDNDFLELVALSKMTDDFRATTCEEIAKVVECILVKDTSAYSDIWKGEKGNEGDGGEIGESHPVGSELLALNGLVHAGYVDCMDEAIRFLVEEENISPEHPMIRNLKSYLEMSGKRLFGALAFQREASRGNGNVIPRVEQFATTSENRDLG